MYGNSQFVESLSNSVSFSTCWQPSSGGSPIIIGADCSSCMMLPTAAAFAAPYGLYLFVRLHPSADSGLRFIGV